MSLKSDLLFYFNNNLFLKSNFFSGMRGSTYVKLSPYMGQCTYNEPYTDSDLRKVGKYSKIANKFTHLSSLQRRMASAIFDQQHRYPPEFRLHINKFRNYDISGLLLFLDIPQDDLLPLLRKSGKSKALQTRIENLYQQLETAWREI